MNLCPKNNICQYVCQVFFCQNICLSKKDAPRGDKKKFFGGRVFLFVLILVESCKALEVRNYQVI